MGLIQVPLKVKDIPELKECFVELGLNTGQLGIDDSTQVPPELFENEHVRIGQKVLAQEDSAAAQQYIRQGSPTALRAELWALILNISSQPEDILYYEQLKTNVIQHDLLVDSLIYKVSKSIHGFPISLVTVKMESFLSMGLEMGAKVYMKLEK